LTFGGEDLINMDAAYFSGILGSLMEMVIACEDKDGDAHAIALFHSARVLLVVLTLPQAAGRRYRYPRDHPGWFRAFLIFHNVS
jgi:uncharacterized membrane protein AbrB (regulator of aidB expression)